MEIIGKRRAKGSGQGADLGDCNGYFKRSKQYGKADVYVSIAESCRNSLGWNAGSTHIALARDGQDFAFVKVDKATGLVLRVSKRPNSKQGTRAVSMITGIDINETPLINSTNERLSFRGYKRENYVRVPFGSIS